MKGGMAFYSTNPQMLLLYSNFLIEVSMCASKRRACSMACTSAWTVQQNVHGASV